MIRRAIALFAFAAPAGLFLAFSACSDETPPENLCNWLSDANNCYARFADDVGTQCGNTFPEGSDPIASATGYFQLRDELEICVKNAGGQVIFDPPLDVSAFPPTSVSFKMLNDRAQSCGSGSYSGEQTFAITIDGVAMDDAGASAPLDDDITGGTFSSALVVDSSTDPPTVREDAFDISCPGGMESHRFNNLTLMKCADLADFLPMAILDSSPGIPESPPNSSSTVESEPGFVRFRVVYPPTDPNVAGAAPRVVEYFNCTIPAPPPPCKDGVKNHDETDIDCGGSCDANCAAGQSCIEGTDCQSGVCENVQGIRTCAE